MASALDVLNRGGLPSVALLMRIAVVCGGRSPRMGLLSVVFDPRPSLAPAVDRRARSAAGAKPTLMFPYISCACVVGSFNHLGLSDTRSSTDSTCAIAA